jgi:hypothetical protein
VITASYRDNAEQASGRHWCLKRFMAGVLHQYHFSFYLGESRKINFHKVLGIVRYAFLINLLYHLQFLIIAPLSPPNFRDVDCKGYGCLSGHF